MQDTADPAVEAVDDAYSEGISEEGQDVTVGETAEEALVREIKEELDTLVSVDEFLMTVEYDYPEFHISMDCFICSVISGELTLLEHESARWLPLSDPWQVRWLPSDIEVIKKLILRFRGNNGGHI